MRKPATTLLLLLAACGGGNSNPIQVADVTAALSRIQPCVEDQVGNLLVALDDLADALQRLLDAESLLEPGSGVTATGDPRVYDFDFGALSGTATFSHDPSQPIALGDTLQISWSYENGTVSGDGLFDLELTSLSTIELTGSGSYADGDCALDVLVADPDALIIDISEFRALAQAGPSASISGRAQVSVNLPPDVLTASLTIPVQGNITLSNTLLNGAQPPTSLPPIQRPNAGPAVPALQGVWRMEWRCTLPERFWPAASTPLVPGDAAQGTVGPFDPNFTIDQANIVYERFLCIGKRDANGDYILDAFGGLVCVEDANGDPIYDPNGGPLLDSDGYHSLRRMDDTPVSRLAIRDPAIEPQIVRRRDADGNVLWSFDPRTIAGISVLTITELAPGRYSVKENSANAPELEFELVFSGGNTANVTVEWTDAAGIENSEAMTWTYQANGWLTKTTDLTFTWEDGSTETVTCEGRARYLRAQ